MQPQLLPQGSSLLLAVSGGQDSMALLALLQDLAPLHGWGLNLWHGDHGWHDNSSRIAAELSSWCQQRHLSLQVDQAAPGEVPSEAKARQWRYERLEQRGPVVPAVRNATAGLWLRWAPLPALPGPPAGRDAAAGTSCSIPRRFGWSCRASRDRRATGSGPSHARAPDPAATPAGPWSPVRRTPPAAESCPGAAAAAASAGAGAGGHARTSSPRRRGAFPPRCEN